MYSWPAKQKTECYQCVAGLLFSLLFYPSLLLASSDKLQDAINTQSRLNSTDNSSQTKINKLADQSQDLLAQYKQVTREAENLKIYNNNLEKLIHSQTSEITSLNKQLSEIDATNHGIVPLMIRMLESLDKFIDLDVPFLLTERKNRIAVLNDLLVNASITTSEKYRRIMEAFQIEAEYGRTIETYRGSLSNTDNKRTVDFLRIGRLSLVYLTLDGNDAFVWDHGNSQWTELSGSYVSQIQKGIRIAKKQAAPELLSMPLSSKKIANKVTQ